MTSVKNSNKKNTINIVTLDLYSQVAKLLKAAGISLEHVFLYIGLCFVIIDHNNNRS